MKQDSYDKMIEDLYIEINLLSSEIRLTNLKYRDGIINRKHFLKECLRLRSDIREVIPKIYYLEEKKEEQEKEPEQEEKFAMSGDSTVMECDTMVKLMQPRKKIVYDTIMCDICRKYIIGPKWFVTTHKATVHNIPIPPDAKI